MIAQGVLRVGFSRLGNGKKAAPEAVKRDTGKGVSRPESKQAAGGGFEAGAASFMGCCHRGMPNASSFCFVFNATECSTAPARWRKPGFQPDQFPLPIRSPASEQPSPTPAGHAPVCRNPSMAMNEALQSRAELLAALPRLAHSSELGFAHLQQKAHTHFAGEHMQLANALAEWLPSAHTYSGQKGASTGDRSPPK